MSFFEKSNELFNRNMYIMTTCKYLTILVFLFTPIIFYAQHNQESLNNTTFFEYGSPVLKSEDNLNNLFKNFSLLVQNGDDLGFISYEFVGTVKSKSAAMTYVKNNMDNLPPLEWATAFYSNKSEFDNNSSPSFIRFMNNSHAVSNLATKEIINSIEEGISIGDEIYEVVFAIKPEKYKHFIFINPVTKKVLLKGNIFGLKIPITHIESILQAKETGT